MNGFVKYVLLPAAVVALPIPAISADNFFETCEKIGITYALSGVEVTSIKNDTVRTDFPTAAYYGKKIKVDGVLKEIKISIGRWNESIKVGSSVDLVLEQDISKCGRSELEGIAITPHNQ